MDLEELLPRKKDDPLSALAKQDLDPLSRDELQARIAELEAEIERTRSHLAKAGNVMSAADALFSKR